MQPVLLWLTISRSVRCGSFPRYCCFAHRRGFAPSWCRDAPNHIHGAEPGSVFLERPGVDIRSAPSANAPVLGAAPRGTQFTATGREGDWVQVENTRLKGWINSQFLAPDKPR